MKIKEIIKTDSFTFTYHENKGVKRMIGEYRIESNIPTELKYGCLEECEGDGTWDYRVANTRLSLYNLIEIIDVIKQLNNVHTSAKCYGIAQCDPDNNINRRIKYLEDLEKKLTKFRTVNSKELKKMIDEEHDYYIPVIEEFHVGFEYEYLTGSIRQPEHWHKTIFDGIEVYEDDENLHLKDIKDILETRPNEIRVKLLDEDDILSLEWKESKNIHFYEQAFLFGEQFHLYEMKVDHCDYFILRLDDNRKHLIIYILNNDTKQEKPVQIFNGTINNKSELKQIMTMVEIIK